MVVHPLRGPRCQHEVEQDDNGDDWTFSLNQDEVVIKFTDSVTKVKGSKNECCVVPVCLSIFHVHLI